MTKIQNLIKNLKLLFILEKKKFRVNKWFDPID